MILFLIKYYHVVIARSVATKQSRELDCFADARNDGGAV